MTLLNLADIAERLDAEEKLSLKYRFPVRKSDGNVVYELETGRLLDVSEEAQILYVSRGGEVVWVKLEEAVELISSDGT